jgi:tetratricopeptide (TPR) repeat protein
LNSHLAAATTALLSKKGNITAALADFDKGIKLESRNAMAYNNRGNAYLVQGKLKEALETTTKQFRLTRPMPLST